MRGLDYSAARIPGKTIRAAGYDFAIRYVDDPARGLTSKHIRPDEYADLIANGITVWLVCERTIQDSQSGFAGGATLAAAARKGADWVGYPEDGLIFFTADRHLTAPEVQVALQFLDGAASVLGRGATGCYGFSELINAAAAGYRAGGYWLAGSKPAAGSPADVWQRNDGFTTVGGVTCDINEMLRSLSAPGGVQWVDVESGLPVLREGDGIPTPPVPDQPAPAPDPVPVEPPPTTTEPPEPSPAPQPAATPTQGPPVPGFWARLWAAVLGWLAGTR